MKKLSILSVMLLTAALVFSGCKAQADDSSDPFSECSETVDSVVMTDGTWTITNSDSGSMYGISYKEDMKLKATVANNDYTFTSGTAVIAMKTKDVLREEYEDYKTLPAAYKKMIEDKMKEEMEEMLSSMGTVTKSTMNDENITVELELSNTLLSYMKSSLNLNNLPSGTVIKTNKENTKYILEVPMNGKTVTYYASKD